MLLEETAVMLELPSSACHIASKTLAEFNSLQFTAVYPPGAVLFVEEEDTRGVFIVDSGCVKLTLSSRDGKTLIVHLATAGEILGVSSAILGRPYDVTAQTLERSEISFVPREKFLRFLETHPDFSMHVAVQLSNECEAAQREIRSLGLTRSAMEKFARLLLDWCEGSADSSGRKIRLKVLLTHEEIAQMIGTTRETVTRLFAQLRSRNIIEVKGSTVLIGDRGALQQIVTI